MLSLTIFDAVRVAPARPANQLADHNMAARAAAAAAGRILGNPRALVANDTSCEKMVSGGNRS